MTESETERWTPGEVVGFCPECREEFYVPHGGKCPAQHLGETPDLIEYVPRHLLDTAIEAFRAIEEVNTVDDPERPASIARFTLNQLDPKGDRIQ